MSRVGVRIRNSFAAVAVLPTAVLLIAVPLIAVGCSSDSGPSTAPLEAQQAVEDDLDVAEPELVEPTTAPTDVSPLSESGGESGGEAVGEAVGESSGATGVVPEGFSTVMVEVTKADGAVCEVCLWLADTAAERGRGLMGVTSLGTPEGMAFVWEQPTAGAFFMFQTVTPLSIAWFAEPTEPDAGGAQVSTADMDPCLSENSADCERFPAGGEFVLAIEVFQGDLASIGITDGATARLLPDTEAVDCPER